MPPWFSATLLVIVTVLVGLRMRLRLLPIARFAVPLHRLEQVAVAVGVVGLLSHCGAMFGRTLVSHLPGSAAYIAAVNAMDSPSVVLFVAPALLLLAGLRRQLPAPLVVLVLTLLAVGVTMYDHGPVAVHLGTIFVAGVTVAAILTLLVGRPGRQPRGTS